MLKTRWTVSFPSILFHLFFLCFLSEGHGQRRLTPSWHGDGELRTEGLLILELRSLIGWIYGKDVGLVGRDMVWMVVEEWIMTDMKTTTGFPSLNFLFSCAMETSGLFAPFWRRSLAACESWQVRAALDTRLFRQVHLDSEKEIR